MINLFRKIRKQLADSNKPLQYLRYAIGEIVLVVIGILIALAINNWNQERLLKIQQIEILEDFIETLEVDRKTFEQSIKRGENATASIEIVLNHLNADLPYADSLKFYFGSITDTWGVRVNRSIYESLKSEGLAIISNKELREAIVRLYDGLSPGQDRRNERYRDIIDEFSSKILSTRFDAMWEGNQFDWSKKNNYTYSNVDQLHGEMVPLNFEELKNDQEFLYSLKTLRNRRFWLMNFDNTIVRNSINDLIIKIENELFELKK